MKIGKKYLKVLKISCGKNNRINISLEAEKGIILTTNRVKISPHMIKPLYYNKNGYPPNSGVNNILSFYNKKSLAELEGEMVLIGDDRKGFAMVLAYDRDKVTTSKKLKG